MIANDNDTDLYVFLLKCLEAKGSVKVIKFLDHVLRTSTY
jgi:hypothetical protein